MTLILGSDCELRTVTLIKKLNGFFVEASVWEIIEWMVGDVADGGPQNRIPTTRMRSSRISSVRERNYGF
jgi:hypothetical protein